MSQRNLSIYALVILLACIAAVSGLASAHDLSDSVLTFLSVVAGVHGGGVVANTLTSAPAPVVTESAVPTVTRPVAVPSDPTAPVAR